MDRPELLLLDVNETLSDLEPMGAVLASVGLRAEQAPGWFARVLRDGFAVCAAGGSVRFADVAREQAALLLRAEGLDEDLADRVMTGFTGLDVHPDVRRGLPALAASGLRLVTLSNGAASVAESLLERAGLLPHVERVLSVEDAGTWKPDPASYAWALEQCGVPASRAALVAVHPWDVHGAVGAGLGGILVDRTGLGSPSYLSAPTLQVASFDELAAVLG